MIIFHTSQSKSDFANQKQDGYVFKFPDASLHQSHHHELVSSYLKLHELGETVHIFTYSGHLFWALIEQGLNNNCLKRKDLFVQYYLSNDNYHRFNLGPHFEFSGIMGNSHWDGGKHRSNVYSLMGMYKTDKVSMKEFE